MQHIPYILNEGQIDLPEQWLDQSMNIFVLPDDNRTNFVINRALVPFGVSTDEYYEQVLDQFRNNLKGYKELSYSQLDFNQVNSHLLEYQWQTPEGTMTQLTLLSIFSERLLIFTFSSKTGFTPNQKEVLLKVLFSFKAHQ